MNECRNIGRRIAELRTAKGLNQPDFAALGGVKKGAQGLYETGERSPNAEYLVNLHQHGFDVGYILTGVRSGQTIDGERSQLISKFMRLSDRERRAIFALIDGLLGPAPESGSLAAMLSPDELAILKGGIPASFQSSPLDDEE